MLRRQAHVGAQVARPDEGHVEPVDGADLVDVLERVLGLDLRGDDGLFVAALVDVLEEAAEAAGELRPHLVRVRGRVRVSRPG